MKFCPNCGTELPEGSKFCPKCGFSVASIMENVEPQNEVPKSEFSDPQPVIKEKPKPQEQQPVQEVPKRNKRKKQNRVAIIAGAVLLLGIAAFFVFKVLDDNGASLLGNEQVASPKKKAQKNSVFSYRNGDGVGMINEKLEVIEEEVGSFFYPFNEKGVAAFSVSKYDEYKMGLIDRAGNVVVEPIYDGLGDFSTQSGSVPTLQSKNGTMSFTEHGTEADGYSTKMGLIDSEGEIVKPLKECIYTPFYGYTITSFSENNRMGIIDEKGNVLIEPIYYNATVLNEKYIAVRKNTEDQMMSIIDVNGDFVEENFASSIYANTYATNAKNYIMYQAGNGKYGVLDSDLAPILETISTSTPYSSEDGNYLVISKEEGMQTLIDSKGKELFTVDYANLALPNSDGILAANDYDDQRGALFDLEGNMITEFISETVGAIYGTNMFYLSEDIATASEIIDSQGNIILSEFEYYPSQRRVDKFLALYTEEQQFDYETFTLINKDGLILSENAVSYTAIQDDRVFIQEPDGYLMICNSDTGKVLLEKTIEVAEPTADSDE